MLLVLAVILGVLIFNRSDAETTLLRAPGALFQQMPDGRFSNLYTVRVINKTSHEMPVELRLESPAGTLSLMGRDNLDVPPQILTENSVIVELDAAAMKSGTTPVTIGVWSNGKKLQTLHTAFIGPRN